MIILAEALRAISITVLVISSSFYLRHLTKEKKQRKLSAFESIMYIIIQTAIILFAISLLIFTFFS